LNQGAHNGYFYLSLQTPLSPIGYCIGKSIIGGNNYLRNDLYETSPHWSRTSEAPGHVWPTDSLRNKNYQIEENKSSFIIIRVKRIEFDVKR
tara:strand:+ start:270 stop:545 length:276 start_codon:yes stop_codon:yes gene_type:complete